MDKNLPLDAVNVVVWNVLIASAIKEARYKLAFELYYNMKRRHIQPNTRTFNTLFGGLSRIEDWSPYSNILTRAFTTYEQLLVHFETLRTRNPESPDITPWPINNFLTLLGRARHYAKMWDVFFSMNGKLAPDEITYTVMLRAIQNRTSLDEDPVQTETQIEARQPDDNLMNKEAWESQFEEYILPEEGWPLRRDTAKPAVEENVHYKNAQDARLLFDSLLKASKKDQNLSITAQTLTPTIQLLAYGKPSDQNYAFQLLREYVPLEHPPLRVGGPTTTSKSIIQVSSKPKVQVTINSAILQALFELCVRSARFESAIHYFQKIAEDVELKNLLDWRHMISVLRAFAMRRPPKGQVHDAREAISALEWMLREEQSRKEARGLQEEGEREIKGLRPSPDHFIYALTAAWRGEDMSSALLVFERMTGLKRETFMSSHIMDNDGTLSLSPTNTRGIEPNKKGVQWPKLPTHLRTQEYCSWNVICMALLVKTAAATQRGEDMRIAMRILWFTRPSRYFFDSIHTHKHLKYQPYTPSNGAEGEGEMVPVTEENLAAQKELANRSVTMLDWLLNTSVKTDKEVARWKHLREVMVAKKESLMRADVRREDERARERQVERLRRMGKFDSAGEEPLVPLTGKRSRWADDV
ncbi:hypothetical protein CPB86DRAFT_783056 [Serendipita vermifera]|nr:hypothetical protein CPB86DRAFT_783056 [Serendipita vermifera]